MGTDCDIPSVQKSTVGIDKDVFAQLYPVSVIAMERRTDHRSFRNTRHQFFQQFSVPVIIRAQPAHDRQQLLGMLKTHLQLRRGHISQLAATHLLYFCHIPYSPIPLINTNFFSSESDSSNSNPSHENPFSSSGFPILFFNMKRVISPRDILVYTTIVASFPFFQT
jgi:hypothetical protein